MSEEQPQPATPEVRVVKRGRGRPRKVDLPPAGHARDEELRKRTDTLEAAAETRAAALDIHAMNPKAFHVDNEIASKIPALEEVTHAAPGYTYRWVLDDRPQQPSVQLKMALTERVKDDDGNIYKCWDVVRGDMLEARESVDVRGYRKIGDVILLRCKTEHYEALRAYAEYQARRRTVSTSEELHALASKAGIRVYDDLKDSPLARTGLGAKLDDVHFQRQLRTGTVPGAEIGSRT